MRKMECKYLNLFFLLCCTSFSFQPVVAQNMEQSNSATLRTLDEIPDWIYKNVKFPEEAYRYGMAGIEQFVISATWDGRVFITSGLNTLNPAFEEEIKSILGKAPRCKFAGNSIEDIYKLVKIDFSIYIPAELRPNVQCIERHLPPSFVWRGEKIHNLERKKQFVKWMSSKFRLPRNADFANYNDTVSLYYTVTEEGILENIRVDDCKSDLIKTELEKLMERSPQWTPAITDSKISIPVSIKDRIIVRMDEYGKKTPFEIYVDEVCRNSASAPTDSDMIVLNPEIRIQYDSDNKSFIEVIRDSLVVDSKVKYVGSFVVEKNGTVSNIYTEATDAKADSTITALIKRTKWIPAQQGGELVRAIYTFAGVQLPPAHYVYAVPPHKNSQKARWDYFKKAYPEADAVIHGERKFKYLSSDDYMEALMKRGFPVFEIKKHIVRE